MDIAIALFPRVTALDAIGPYEVLQRLPGATVTFVGAERGEIRTENGFLGLSVDATFDEVPAPDVVVVPGGIGTRTLLDPGTPLLDWVQAAHRTSRWTTSVCTGSLVLAAAGLLDGLTAATHWASYDALAALGRDPDRATGGRAPRLSGSSPPPGCPPASTWRCAWPSCSSTPTPPAPCSS